MNPFSSSMAMTSAINAALHCRRFPQIVLKMPMATSVAAALPTQARVVICGGGIIGNSVAYHMSERGYRDVVLLEQGSLTCGTTWHSSGLIGALRDSAGLSRMYQYSKNLYKEFEESGNHVGWKQCGSIRVARTDNRLIQLKRRNALAKTLGVEAEVISPSEIRKYCTHIAIDGLKGALYIPGDGVVTPSDVTMTFSSLAKRNGVRYFEGVSVERILTEHGTVSEVETTSGKIKCEHFVNCGGMWAPEIGKKSQPAVKVPLHPCEHYSLLTKPLECVDRMMPVVRDPDGYIYAREWSGALLLGGFEPIAKPIFHHGIPEKFEFQLLPENWSHFEVLLNPMMRLLPLLKDAEIKQLIVGPESFTADGSFVLGESSEIRNYFVAAGMNCGGVVGGGAAGKHIADWIIDGQASINMWPFDIQRFLPVHNSRKFLYERATEILGKCYTVKYPFMNNSSARNLCATPLYSTLKKDGAIFGEIGGYERPLWFDPSHDRTPIFSHFIAPGPREHHLGKDNFKGSFGKPVWFEATGEEYRTCKEGVCVIDAPSFAKFEITSDGTEAVEFLQYICSNNIDQEQGTIVHTGMQNQTGGYEVDGTVVVVEKNRFLLIVPIILKTKCLTWLNRNKMQHGTIEIHDLTSAFTCINIIGPNSQKLLHEVSDMTASTDFKPWTSKLIDVGYAQGVRTLQLTLGGVDRFVLYVPSQHVLQVYNSLMDAGEDLGVRNAGYLAIHHLGLENSVSHWGFDLNCKTTPMECGRDHRVDYKKPSFIGKDSLLKQRERGISKRFVQLRLQNHDAQTDLWPYGGENIYRDGRFVGYTTSASYGYSVGQMICLGFINNEDENGHPAFLPNMDQHILNKNTNYEIGVAGKYFSATAVNCNQTEAM